MDRAALAHFLRSRREALRPEDVGLPRGSRRRTAGLRREEIAALSGVSADYYARIEQQRGALPSEQVIAAIAAGLRLSAGERDHLFRLAGHPAPRRVFRSDHINPGMMRIFDQLEGDAAEVMNSLGESLRQTRLAVAIFGDEALYSGRARSRIYRWFTDPTARMLYPEEDRPRHSMTMAGTLRAAYAKDGEHSRAAELARALLTASAEFADLWNQYVIAGPYFEPKRILHPQAGLLELHAQTLIDPDQSQSLLVFTPIPGTGTREKLQFLSVVGADA